MISLLELEDNDQVIGWKESIDDIVNHYEADSNKVYYACVTSYINKICLFKRRNV